MAEVTRERLKSYFETGDKPTQEEFNDFIDSVVHKEDGVIISNVEINSNGDVIFTYTNGDITTIEKYQLPNQMPVDFISGLQAALDSKTNTGGYPGTAQDLYNLLAAIKTIYTADGSIKEVRTIDGAGKSGKLVFDDFKEIQITNSDNFTVQNSITKFDLNLFEVNSDKTIDLNVPAANARILLEGGVSLQNGSQAPGKYLQSVDNDGKTVWKNLEVSDLNGIAEMVQDMLINSGATDKIASVKAIEDFVATKISELIDNSDGALDTLNELAQALGNNPDFATDITTLIATKLASGGYAGTAQDLFNEILSLQSNKLDKGSYTGTAADLDATKRDKTAQAKSITDNAGNLELVGDVETPSNDSFYGTNSSGAKTFTKVLDVFNFLTYKKELYMESEYDFNDLLSIPTEYFNQDFSFNRDGKYVFICNITTSSYSTNTDFVASLVLDNTTTLDKFQEEFKDGEIDQRYKRTLFATADITSGTHNLKLVFNDSSFSIAELHRAEVLIFKVADSI